MTKIKGLKPCLKWVGGKRQLLPEIRKRLPEKIERYYEPFLGGGALLFDMQPKRAHVSDINPELMNVYSCIKYMLEELIEELSSYKNDEAFFYEVRGWDREENYHIRHEVQKAARFIFLNKTCFNGLYRVNQSGEFNAPYGKYKNPKFLDIDTLRAIKCFFTENEIEFSNSSFTALDHSSYEENAFVYLDPPYDVKPHNTNFTGYTKGGFDRKEQKRVNTLFNNLTYMGVKVLLSNAATPFIEQLYSGKGYTIERVKAKRSVNSKGNGRKAIDEFLIRNY